MKITSSIRRYLATALVTGGLAYPVCAAVCPKGRSGCPSPGKCFLFTDTDGNSLCDYTSGSGADPSVSSGQVQQPVGQPTTVPTSAQALTDSTSAQSAGSSSVSQALPFTALLAGAFLFIALCGILYTGVRKGFLGIHIRRPGPALAFSSLVALGFSLMVTGFLAGEAIQGMDFALVYLIAGTGITAYLWHEGVMSRRIILVLAGVSALAGFVFAAPIMPGEFIGIVTALAGISSLTPAIIILGAVIVLTVVIGRAFCGHICPVGSLQELAFDVPVKKITIRRTGAFELVRAIVFAAAALAALYLVDLMAYTGMYALFSLAISATVVVGAAVIVLSLFVYRPVCRILCPFGLLFSIPAGFSLFRLRRNGTCILCKKCEKACPSGCAGRDDSKRECYLCGRCTETCPVEGALRYRR